MPGPRAAVSQVSRANVLEGVVRPGACDRAHVGMGRRLRIGVFVLELVQEPIRATAPGVLARDSGRCRRSGVGAGHNRTDDEQRGERERCCTKSGPRARGFGCCGHVSLPGWMAQDRTRDVESRTMRRGLGHNSPHRRGPRRSGDPEAETGRSVPASGRRLRRRQSGKNQYAQERSEDCAPPHRVHTTLPLAARTAA